MILKTIRWHKKLLHHPRKEMFYYIRREGRLLMHVFTHICSALLFNKFLLILKFFFFYKRHDWERRNWIFFFIQPEFFMSPISESWLFFIILANLPMLTYFEFDSKIYVNFNEDTKILMEMFVHQSISRIQM